MIQCPKCRAGLSPTHLDGLPAQTCKQCHGLWLAREFVELWAERRGPSGGAPARPFELRPGPSTAPVLACPDCAVGMARVDAHGLQVEHCSVCQGVFFDRGELEAIGRRITGQAVTGRRHATSTAASPKPLAPRVADSMIDDLRRADSSSPSTSSDSFLGMIGWGILEVLDSLFDG